MGALRILVSRLLGLFHRTRAEAELDAEVHAHLDALAQEHMRRGMALDEARYAARREFGGVEQIKEDYRQTLGLPVLEVLIQDLRYSARVLRKNPGFAAVVVLTLALGIGANTAIFSIVDAVLLRPLPFPHANRIMALYQTLPEQGVIQNGTSYLNFVDWREQGRSFEAMGAYHDSEVSLSGFGGPEMVPNAIVTSGLLSTLAGRPILGRVMIPADDEPGAPLVVLMSERLWRRRFGAASDIVGRTITLDKQAFTVIGILPAEFRFPFVEPAVDLWMPVQQDTQLKALVSRRGGHYLRVVGRLKPGVTVEQAQTELVGIQARLAAQYPAENAGWGARVAPLQQEIVGDVQLELLVLLGAVAVVLLIACVNVANLLVARATSRSRELAVRAALGAGKRRIIRQLLTESLLLGGIGGALGAATAWWAMRAMNQWLPDDLPRIHNIEVDAPVLWFTLGLTLLVSLLFGLAPALQATSGNLANGLKEGMRGSSDGIVPEFVRGALVTAEVALAVVLLTGAGLLLHSFVKLQSVSPGFRTKGILTATVTLPQSQYTKPEEWAAFSRRALQQIKALPGVTDAAAAAPLPMSGRINLAFTIDGRSQTPEDHTAANYSTVSPAYFQVMGIPILRGRAFDERDIATSQNVTIISDSFARRYFQKEDPLGRHLSLGFPPNRTSKEIVGVAADIKSVSLDAPAEPATYAPYEQSPFWALSFAVRTEGDPATLALAVRARIHELDKDLPIEDVRPIGVLLANSVALPRFRTLLVALFGALALILAAVGIYGVISYSVAQRTREIGLRMALGAAPAGILKLVLRQGMKPVLAGLSVGLLGAFGLTRLFRSLLFGVTPGDPLTYGGTIFLLLMIAILARYVPARRAMRVDPMIALRYE